jgi:uncharacterized membrane protein
MRTSKRRALTWALVALGIAMVVLGGVLIATFPWSQAGAPFAHFWAQGQGMPPGAQPDAGQWFGHPHGWGFFHGPRFFGGGLFFLVLVILGISLAFRRGRYRRSFGPDERLDAEEILKRSFAEGRITEEEYKSRLGTLRK